MRKNIFSLIVTGILLLSLLPIGLVGCNRRQEQTELSVGGEVGLLEGAELDYENMLFDDFTGGVNKDNWYIGKQAWGANGNGGVVPQNVNYTDDGVLILSGNGEYYTSGDVKGVGQRKDGTLTGAALISKFVTGAGRYEVKMKVLPRLGACSAFWTYAYDGETGGNHEIDIELPGGKSSSVISFQNVLNTNYITEQQNQSQDVNISKLTDGKINTLNDGEWHTYGFDWYTVENGESSDSFGEDVSTGRVVYYIDGRITAISDVFVPYYQARLWLGVWFPNNAGFVGTANFESDSMYVDWVRYTPFKDQAIVEFIPAVTGDVASDAEYPSAPVATVSVNKVANGDFEYAVRGAANSGWEYYKRAFTQAELNALKESVKKDNPTLSDSEINEIYNNLRKQLQSANASDYCSVSDGLGLQSSCGVQVKSIGLVAQTIDSIYDCFKIEFSFYAKGNGTVTVLFFGNGNDSISREIFNVDGSEFARFEKSLVAPEGTRRVEIEIASAGDSIWADDIVFKVV